MQLPPLQQQDGYATDSGRRGRDRVQLPGFYEVAGPKHANPNHRWGQVSIFASEEKVGWLS